MMMGKIFTPIYLIASLLGLSGCNNETVPTLPLAPQNLISFAKCIDPVSLPTELTEKNAMLVNGVYYWSTLKKTRKILPLPNENISSITISVTCRKKIKNNFMPVLKNDGSNSSFYCKLFENKKYRNQVYCDAGVKHGQKFISRAIIMNSDQSNIYFEFKSESKSSKIVYGLNAPSENLKFARQIFDKAIGEILR